jgi:hypothetical protein
MSDMTGANEGENGAHGATARAREIAQRARGLASGGGRVAVPLAAGGAAAMCLSWPLHSRPLRAAVVVATFAGGALYARERLAERSDRINEAESRVHEALDGLDPIARAQVLADQAR